VTSTRGVYSSVSCHAFGGYRQAYRGHELLAEAVTGIEVRFGGDDQPTFCCSPIDDFGTGHLATFAIRLGLFTDSEPKKAGTCGRRYPASERS